EFEIGNAREVGLLINDHRIAYDTVDKKVSALGEAPLTITDGKIKFRVLVDRTSMETFVNDGQRSFTSNVSGPVEKGAVTAFAKGGTAGLLSLKVYPLKSVILNPSGPR